MRSGGIFRVDDGEDRFRGRGRISTLCQHRFPPLGDLLSKVVVRGKRSRTHGGGAAPVGVEAARLHKGHAHAELGHLSCERLGEPFERPLRRVVEPEPWERRDASDRGDLKDVSTPLGAQYRRDGLGDPERAEHVGLDLRAGLALGELFDHAEEPVARVVHDDVDAPQLGMSRLHRSLSCCAVRHVESERYDAVAVLCDEILEGARVPGGGCDSVSTFERVDRPLPAKTSRCSSDEPVLAHAAPRKRGR